MKVVIAKKAGFCMGVRRAVDLTLDLVNKGESNISTFGPLIHNPQVLGVLQDKGVGILKHVPKAGAGTVIIRAHGVPPEQKERLKKSGLTVKDATCPRVLKVQAIINKHRKQGKTTVIVGDRNHAEVDGLMGYAGSDCHVISNDHEAESLVLTRPYIIVCQTTQDELAFDRITEIIIRRNPNGEVFNTICDSTHRRQEEVRNLCDQVEAIVVVGGKTSANTKRLAEIAEGLGRLVFLIESEEELDVASLREFDCVGVTAGASTPTWMINRVVRALEAIPGRSDNPLFHGLFRVVRLLMVSNFYVAFGGGLLASACGLLQGLEPRISHAFVAFCYLFAMHNINRLTDQQSKIFDDPVYLRFNHKYRKTMMSLATLFLFIGLGITFNDGWPSFALLLVMSVFGVLYRIHFIPRFLAARIKVSRLKEIPASKTFFVALAWAMVVVLLPAVGAGTALTAKTYALMLLILLLVFVRNALFDVFQVQGDRIVGKETLPVLIGAPKTIQVLNCMMGILLIALAVFPSLGLIVIPVGYFLFPGILYLAGFTYLYSQEYWSPGVKLEFALETTFVIMALSVWGGNALYPS
ncbi:MAG: 4-hydroxy-3-methylbut-2-enyl diphosphate reductase [Proteobacteria bacterium]|nr:4-hydroxy-3-methylbut-2-enyl diphosphate reductase [Desulfobulbaceae bacterium]MBU4151309.1 4-hydroxy-3-methylbut-2-enyl diphosphate reductase [Pseudomonadota bacterium]